MSKTYHQAYIRLRSKTTREWFVHPDLRSRLVADAIEQETSIADVATRILADRFAVSYEAARRRSNPSLDDKDVLNMRVPRAVWRVIKTVANESDRDDNDVARAILCSHYGLPLPTSVAA